MRAARAVHLGPGERGAHPPPAVARPAGALPAARHAGARAPGRPQHAARTGRLLRRLGALRGLPRSRAGRLPRDPGRPERPPPFAVLPVGISRLGARRAAALPAGPGGAHPDAEAELIRVRVMPSAGIGVHGATPVTRRSVWRVS